MPVTTKLKGGCGNQLFQFAMGLAQARRLGVELLIDSSGFVTDRMREYNLCLFPRITHRITDDIKPATVNENGMPYNEKLAESIKDGDILDGYWQTENYFRSSGGIVDVSSELRWYLQPKPLTVNHRNILHSILGSKNSTFLTVRRTDYVGNSFHGEMTLDYYIRALNLIKDNKGEPTVFVFSDEPDWCQQNFKIPFKTIVAGTYDRTVKGHIGREDADLYLMSVCENAVMANSSFSWWGAFLGDANRKGMVIAPKQWFGPASNEDAKDIVPKRWLKI